MSSGGRKLILLTFRKRILLVHASDRARNNGIRRRISTNHFLDWNRRSRLAGRPALFDDPSWTSDRRRDRHYIGWCLCSKRDFEGQSIHPSPSTKAPTDDQRRKMAATRCTMANINRFSSYSRLIHPRLQSTPLILCITTIITNKSCHHNVWLWIIRSIRQYGTPRFHCPQRLQCARSRN
jgi:hypothetical protein